MHTVCELLLPDGFVEDALEIALSQGGALQVFDSFNVFGDLHSLLMGDRRHSLLTQTFLGRLVVTEVKLCAHQNYGNGRRMMLNLGVPLTVTKIRCLGPRRSKERSNVPWL